MLTYHFQQRACGAVGSEVVTYPVPEPKQPSCFNHDLIHILSEKNQIQRWYKEPTNSLAYALLRMTRIHFIQTLYKEFQEIFSLSSKIHSIIVLPT